MDAKRYNRSLCTQIILSQNRRWGKLEQRGDRSVQREKRLGRQWTCPSQQSCYITILSKKKYYRQPRSLRKLLNAVISAVARARHQSPPFSSSNSGRCRALPPLVSRCRPIQFHHRKKTNEFEMGLFSILYTNTTRSWNTVCSWYIGL